MKNDEKKRKQQWENDEKIEKNMKHDEKKTMKNDEQRTKNNEK